MVEFFLFSGTVVLGIIGFFLILIMFALMVPFVLVIYLPVIILAVIVKALEVLIGKQIFKRRQSGGEGAGCEQLSDVQGGSERGQRINCDGTDRSD